MHENPGSPFELSIDLKPRTGGAVTVEIREGAPFKVLASLSAQSGSLSTTTLAVIDPGEASSEDIEVIPSGDLPVTVRLDAAEYRNYVNYFGLSAQLGAPITVSVPTSTSTSTSIPVITPTPEVAIGELPTDDPPVNFRVTGYSHDWVGIAWEVPDNRGITNYALQRADYGGEEFISSVYRRHEGTTNGGAGHALSDSGDVEPDTRYRYTLQLKNALGTIIIENAVEARTSPLSGTDLSSDATLSDLTLSGVSLDRPFNPRIDRYDGSVPERVAQTTVTPTVSHVGATYEIKVGGTPYDDGVVPLNEGKNVIKVYVAAEDDVVTRIYTIVVTRGGALSSDASLRGLSMIGVDFGTFDPEITSYSGDVANGVLETTVVPTLNDPAASYVIKLGGVEDTDGVVPLVVGANAVTVEVTAEDGKTTRTYAVTVTRAAALHSEATLRSLSLSDVDFGNFSARALSYSATVSNGITQTTVSATPSHSGASHVVKLNGTTHADGVVPLSVGDNVITVEVTAKDRNITQTYTVTVTRQEVVETGELPGDDPPVNFRLSSAEDSVSINWSIPRDRDITNWELRLYSWNGSALAKTRTTTGNWSGGTGGGTTLLRLESDTLHKVVLQLKTASGTVVIEKSGEIRTLASDDSGS